MHERLIELFLLVSESLLAPVMLLLVGAMLAVVWFVGQTTREACERGWRGRNWRRFMLDVRAGRASPDAWRTQHGLGLVRHCAQRTIDLPEEQSFASLPHDLADVELAAARRLGRLQVLVRVGPMLGLAGTLIPLGPALQGLSTADFSRVGQDLSIAFTTTVFGIVIGGIAYALHGVQRGWYDRDLNDLECLLAIRQARFTHGDK